jgi:transposase-like protein
MQRIFASPWDPDEYLAAQAHQQIVAESICPRCAEPDSLHRHGCYARWVVNLLGELLRLCIARFLCRRCRRTISYLPDFALSYRPLGPEAFAAFLDGERARADVRTFGDLLHRYQRRLEAFGAELIRTVGAGLGMPPPSPRSPADLWPWLKKAGDGLRPVTRHLVSVFRIGLFRRYQCHQPAGP